jgi:hypothetical protein
MDKRERLRRIDELVDKIIDARKDADADFKASRIDVDRWVARHISLNYRSNRLAAMASKIRT